MGGPKMGGPDLGVGIWNPVPTPTPHLLDVGDIEVAASYLVQLARSA